MGVGWMWIAACVAVDPPPATAPVPAAPVPAAPVAPDVALVPHPPLMAGSGLKRVMFSADGQSVATTGGDRRVRVWRLGVPDPVVTLEVKASGLSLSATGDRIALGRKGSAEIWQVSPRRRLPVLSGHWDWVEEAILTDDDTRVLTQDDSSALRWFDGSGALVATLDDLPRSGHIHPLPGDPFVWVSKNGWIGWHDAVEDVPLRQVRFLDGGGWVMTARATPEYLFLAVTDRSTDHRVAILDRATGDPVVVLRGHRNVINGLSASADGTWVATGSQDHTLRLWHAPSGTAVAVEDLGSWVYSVALSADGGWLLASTEAREIRVYQIVGASTKG